MEINLIGTEALEIALATASVEAVAAAGPLAGAVLHLSKSPLVFDRNIDRLVLLQSEADYTGYLSLDIEWLAVSRGDGGVIEIVGQVAEFRPTGSAVENTIHGIWVDNPDGTKIWFSAAIPGTPLPMVGVLDSILLVLRYRPRGEAAAAIVS